MTIFIDFDDVLFNTLQFKRDIKKVFADHGVSDESYTHYYFPSDLDIPIKTYDPRAQIKRICAGEGMEERPLMNAVDKFLRKECSHYVFADVIDFVEQNKGNKIVIVSFGDKRMQEEKIQRSGIGKIIKDVIITELQKSSAIKAYLANESEDQSFFIDDRVEQIEDVKKYLPKMKTILLKRKEGRYQDQMKNESCDHEAHSLDEVIKIINKK